MYSVNIDKLVDIGSNEAKCFENIAENITGSLAKHKAVAVISGKTDTFKIAYSIMEQGNKVLFIDGDIKTDVFLGKYKLGKNAKGVLDYLKNPEKNHELICVTNHKKLNIIFTGMNVDGVVTDDEKMIFKALVDKYRKDYDYIVVDCDDEASLAQFCGYVAIITDKNKYDVEELNDMVAELEDMDCRVLGVVIRE